MKLVKSLLLGSAAGLAAVAGAQAADLPVRKAAPVEYVRICSAYGAGFFYIPGTDTCLRVSGRARFEYQYTESFSRVAGAGNVSGYRGLGRMNLDARTQTAYGTLRAFVRFDIASRTGAYLTSGSQFRQANAFRAEGIDTANSAQKFVDVDKAFIQFAGFTAGKAASFYDFYAHDHELIGSSVGSDQASTNLLAYTAQLGNGFSATISMEDPTFRRNPIFNYGAVAAGGVVTNFGLFTSVNATAPVVGPGGLTFIDVTQKNRMPDFVGNLRYDAPWGSAQISAAVHELALGNYAGNVFPNALGVAAGTVGAVPRVQNAYGWGIQGGVKINAPFIAAGDNLYLQGSYGQGSLQYAGISGWAGYDTPTTATATRLTVTNVDAVVNPFTRRLDLTDAFAVTGSFLHYWTPEWRSAFFGSYGEVHNPRGARVQQSLLGIPGGLQPIVSAAALNAFNFNATLRDYNVVYAGASLIWSPVRDLDIGVEGVYQRVAITNGRVADANTFGTGGAVAGVPLRARSSDDQVLVRFRIQRDF